MNCQEVTELMQRYLDKDLDKKEHDIIIEHLRVCPECTDMFERLQRLSSDLENLPKVSPPYSIVDSIMPRLMEIDRMKEESVAQGDGVDPNTHSSSKSSPSPARRKFQNRYFSWKWASGVVAAALILGIYMFQQQPSLPEHADGSLPGQMEQSGMSTFNITQIPDQRESTALSNSEIYPLDQYGVPGRLQVDFEASAQQTTDPVPPREKAAETIELETRRQMAADEPTRAETPAPAHQTDEIVTKQAEANAPSPKATQEISNEMEGSMAGIASFEPEQDSEDHSVSGEGGSGDLGDTIGIQQFPEAADEDTVTGPQQEWGETAVDPEGSLDNETAQKEDPLTANDVQSESVPSESNDQGAQDDATMMLRSPDQKLNAVVKQNRVIIMGEDGREIYTSIFQWYDEDAVILKEWVDRSLIYEVTMDTPTGSEVRHVVIDLNSNQEKITKN